MKSLHVAVTTLALVGLLSTPALSAKNIVCYYDSTSALREGLAKLVTGDLEVALEYCTHLIYGYAGINPTLFQLTSLNVDLDMFHYQQITALKAKFPKLKVFLSVGGDKDRDAEHPLKYMELLEAPREQQLLFIESALALLKSNRFDGLDLAFQLPRNKPRKVHGWLGTQWKAVKKLFTGDFVVDPKADEHKRQFTDFAKDLKSTFGYQNLSLSLTVLPNVNSSWYFEPRQLVQLFDFVNLASFDFLTPERNPEEADFTAPIDSLSDQNRLPHYSIQFQVNYWLDNLWPAEKLNIGIASYGRAWKMTTDSGLTGMPVVAHTDGPAEAGLQSRTPGLLSWPEICSKLPSPTNTDYRGANAPLRKVIDLQRRSGNYALRPADDNNEHGIWVSYDDPDMAGIKARYARERGLGGVALFDLGYDDFRGLCVGQKYPILRSLKMELY